MSRKIDKLDIKGIDSRNIITSKGYCSEIKNLRYTGTVWENTSEFTSTQEITVPSDYEIIYIHDFLGIKNFIVQKSNDLYYLTTTSDNETEAIYLCSNINNKAPKIYHFGNYLCIKYTAETPCKEKQYVWINNKYIEFNLDLLTPLNNISFAVDTYEKKEYLVAEIDVFDSSNYMPTKKRYSYDYEAQTLENEGYITGIVYLFFTYKLFDGSTVKSSKIYLLPTQENISPTVSIGKNDNNYKIYTYFQGCKVSFEISLDNDIFDNELVESIVIYSTRDNNLIDLDKIELQSYMASAIYAEFSNRYNNNDMNYLSDYVKDCLQNPFYKLKEISLSDFVEGKHTVTITKEDFNDIVFNDIYAANYSHHTTTSTGDYEFNNRLHRYDIHTILYEGYSPFITDESYSVGSEDYTKRYDDNEEIICVVTLEGDTEKTNIAYRMQFYEYQPYKGHGSFFTPNIISYPDARAKELSIYYTYNNNVKKAKTFTLTTAYNINYSYFVDYSSKYLIYNYQILQSEAITSNLPITNNLLIENNKVIVSNFGNPYYFNPIHTYYIGEVNSTKIYNASSILSDSAAENAGIYPLTIFSSDGIYLLEQGTGEILYTKILKVSKDTILNSSNTLSYEQMLFFITPKGLAYLSNSKIKYLSDNFKSEDLEYFKTAHILHLRYYNEIMIYNEQYDYAYIYSIKEGLWSTRDIHGKVFSNTELFDGTYLLDVSTKEDPTKPLKPYFMTREIDYSNLGLARIDTAVAEIRSDALVSYNFNIFGSVDLKNWYPIGSSSDYSKIRRTSSSWRYFKFEISVDAMNNLYIDEYSEVAAQFTISHILLELYDRFAKHLNSSNSGNTYMS